MSEAKKDEAAHQAYESQCCRLADAAQRAGGELPTWDRLDTGQRRSWLESVDSFARLDAETRGPK